jgi:hypothetical protein
MQLDAYAQLDIDVVDLIQKPLDVRRLVDRLVGVPDVLEQRARMAHQLRTVDSPVIARHVGDQAAGQARQVQGSTIDRQLVVDSHAELLND